MRTVVEDDVLRVEEVGLVETWSHAEWQVVAEMRFPRDLGEGHGVGPALHGGKIEAAALLKDERHDFLDSSLGRVRDRCGRCGRTRLCPRAEHTVLVAEIAGASLQLVCR